MQVLIENKQQLLYLYIPMLISITWGFVSHSLNWDDKHLDSVFAVYPLIATSSFFYLGFFHYKIKRVISLFAGLVYLILIYALFLLNQLPMKTGDKLTVILLIFYFVLYIISIVGHLLSTKWSLKFNIIIFNIVLVSILPFVLLGYLTIFTSLIGLVYWFI
jgi:hypothetical protein